MNTLKRVVIAGSIMLFPFSSAFATVATDKSVYSEGDPIFVIQYNGDADGDGVDDCNTAPNMLAIYNLDTGSQINSVSGGCRSGDNMNIVDPGTPGHFAWVETLASTGDNCAVQGWWSYEECVTSESFVSQAIFCTGGEEYCTLNP